MLWGGQPSLSRDQARAPEAQGIPAWILSEARGSPGRLPTAAGLAGSQGPRVTSAWLLSLASVHWPQLVSIHLSLSGQPYF